MDKIGIEPNQLLLQIVNFGVIAFILTKFLYNPILKMLEERKKKIEEGLSFTERMKKEDEKTAVKRQEILDNAKKEAKKIIEEGKKAGKMLEADILAKAKEEAEGIIAKGKKDLEAEREEMERHLKRETVEIASHMVEKVLEDILDDKKHRLVIEKKMKSIRSV